ncbi:hypothetical protein PLICBS_001902 [Purpureocillium lilacinum]|uniref:uncharacterized protein n=1 Tax=Purpureocillium lilacinum TaxID=33203 RepID=UPI002080D2C6|nr:hypothetical protein PLICBS_001902 [Purpureocillium lilacinum]
MLLHAAGLVAVIACGLAGPAFAAEPDPVLGKAVFNNPAGSETEQYAIFQQLARVIDRVPAGEYLELSWFGFDTPYTTDTASKPNLPQRLARAHKRGVNVRIVLDNSKLKNSKAYPYKTLAPALGTNDAAKSFIVLCPDKKGCIAKRKIYDDMYAYNHNKFLIASRIELDNGKNVSNVVFQSSSNLGTWDADTAWNNAVTWSETESFTNYHRYFGDLKANHDGKGNDNYYRVGSSSSTFKTHFFPRKETNGDLNQASTDTIVSVLDSVKCSYVGADKKKHQTDVRVVMWAFTRVAVAKKLAALARDGCWVDVAYTESKANVLAELKKTGGKKIGVTKCAVAFKGRNLRPHSKYMLIDGAYDGDLVPRIYMGSHNYAVSALRNADETMVRVKSSPIHASYLHNFYTVRDACSGKTPPK